MPKFSGTFQGRTSGPDFSEVIQAAVIIGAGVGLAMIIMEFAWLIITISAAALAVRLYFYHRRTVALTVIAAKFEMERKEQAALAAAREERRMLHEIAVAQAGRTVVQNVIDPAAIAAALGVQHRVPQPVPVVRGQVER